MVQSSYGGSEEFNTYLRSFSERIEKKFNLLTATGILPSNDRLRDELKRDEAPIDKGKTFFELWEEFLEISRGGNRQLGTVKTYQTALNHLKAFEKNESVRINFARINRGFHDRLNNYLLNKNISPKPEETTQNLSLNSIGTIIKSLKTFLKWAEKMGYAEFAPGVIAEFKVLEESAETIYQNPEELEILFKLDLNKTPGIERTRDLFLIGCWTGLRFSDFTQIQAENFVDGNIRVKTQKTGELVIIPLHPIVDFILNKYEGKLPKAISNQKFNEHLKELGKIAGFEEKRSISTTKGGKKDTQFLAKWELISSHTARRSFATNLYNEGENAVTLMKITGHKTERSFLKYIKMDKEQAADTISQNVLFQRPEIKIAN